MWSQALIFVFISLYGTDVTVHMYRVSYVMPAKFFSYGIAILTVAFYLTRAFAKLKDSNRLRRWSAFMLAGIVLVNLQSLFAFISPPVNFLGGILGSEQTKFFSAGFVMMIGWALLLFANHLGEIRYRD